MFPLIKYFKKKQVDNGVEEPIPNLAKCKHEWDKWFYLECGRLKCHKCNICGLIEQFKSPAIHNFGPWKKHGYTSQERFCQTCGFQQLRGYLDSLSDTEKQYAD